MFTLKHLKLIEIIAYVSTLFCNMKASQISASFTAVGK